MKNSSRYTGSLKFQMTAFMQHQNVLQVFLCRCDSQQEPDVLTDVRFHFCTDLWNSTASYVGGLGPNPFQLASSDVLMPVGHVLHLAVGSH